MAAWQVDLYVIPRLALAAAPVPITAQALASTNWWREATLPPDYQARITAMAPPAASTSPDLQTWGAEDGNRIEVRSEAGRPASVRVRVDVRVPDAKFAAALILFLRAADATLVRGDGTLIAPTAGGFGAALRGSIAWRFVHAPTPASDTSVSG